MNDIAFIFFRSLAWLGLGLGLVGVTMLFVLLLEERSIGRDIDDEGGGK